MSQIQHSTFEYGTSGRERLSDGAMPGAWWQPSEDHSRIDCLLCPRQCSLKPGDRGFCFVRENRDGQMVLSTYGKSTGFCIDPIEKKPLNHFLPGTAVLSFGTAGCNLGCKFCQNWDISKSREVEKLSSHAEPETIAEAAVKLGCHSVAFTYNDPVIWAEYAIDSAKACHERGIQAVAVTAGYISSAAREEFYSVMDAANVDLKSFSEEFYHKITYSHLAPVLETLVYLKRHTNVWFEITNLLIPDANDSPDELRRMCDFLLSDLGDDVPVHFTAFHPDFRMRDRPATPHETLIAAYEVAKSTGLKYVYVGNVHDVNRQSTFCGSCGQLLIQRDWYQLGVYRLNGNRCASCNARIPGRFLDSPGNWGAKRQAVRIEQFARPSTETPTLVAINSPSRSSINVALPKDAAMSTVQPLQPVPVAPVHKLASFSEQQRAKIHAAACRWTMESVMQRRFTPAEELLGELSNTIVMGVFVTLKRGSMLRGCCGVLHRPLALGAAISSAAHRTALEDQRLAPVSPSELPYLDVSVTWLGPMEPIDAQGDARAKAIAIGKHGVAIQSGQSSGLLLPSVATENSWDAKRFLDAVCRKAGLPKSAWLAPDCVVFKFEGDSVGSQMIEHEWSAQPLTVAAPLTNEQVIAYCNLAASNIFAIAQGATPSYYVPELPDSNVNAVILSVQLTPTGGEPQQANAIHVSVRPGVALQSTLFQMCQSVADNFSRRQFAGQLQLGITIGIDPALHGYGERVDLAGYDSASRALVLSDPRHCAVAFDPQRSPEELLSILRQNLPVGSRDGAVHSLRIVSSMPQLVAISAPPAMRGSGVRMPAVAGKFYPAEDAARRELVHKLIAGPEPKKQTVRAIMVPHAGLKFSGKIAADGWRSAKLPSTLLIISPKHTPAGVNWAVCPLERWRISSATSINADLELAKQIVERVPGMQFDVAAHENEHGIEVQLPLLEQIAPDAKIVGIAMHGGSWKEIQEAAAALAGVIKELDSPPLLVISSDMNHFGTDEENRRLDRMALDAFESGDSQKLLDTCREHEISMCGVIPAALVLETLHQLGRAPQVDVISYGTSADVTGDKTRVVGYASALIA